MPSIFISTESLKNRSNITFSREIRNCGKNGCSKKKYISIPKNIFCMIVNLCLIITLQESINRFCTSLERYESNIELIVYRKLIGTYFKASSNLTVAAEWNTMLIFSDRKWISSWLMPICGSNKSPCIPCIFFSWSGDSFRKVLNNCKQ